MGFDGITNEGIPFTQNISNKRLSSKIRSFAPAWECNGVGETYISQPVE